MKRTRFFPIATVVLVGLVACTSSNNNNPNPPLQYYSLTVIKNGNGIVTSSPSGIDCGSSCSALFAQNTTVTLTATPDSGSGFRGWSGACGNTDNSCVLTMNTAKQVTALFEAIADAGSFSLSPSYLAGSSSFVIAQKADALYFFKINRQGGFTAPAENFDALEFSGNIIGTDTNQVQAVFRKDLSSGDDLAFVLIGGATAPLGDYTVSVVTRAGAVSSSPVIVNLKVTGCSSGC